jgi:hypothetical protein
MPAITTETIAKPITTLAMKRPSSSVFPPLPMKASRVPTAGMARLSSRISCVFCSAHRWEASKNSFRVMAVSNLRGDEDHRVAPS